MSIRVFAISDSPRISTGFGNVAKQIYQGFHDAGWEVHALGMLDTEMDNKKELPYAFYPVLIDMMGFGDLQLLLPRIRPDIVWIMIDPGNLLRHIVELLKIKEESKLDFKIVAYPPVEGRPLSHFQIEALKEVMKHGRLVFWTQSAVDIAREAGIDNPDYVHFGVDHAPFRKYPDDVKAKLKANVGLKDKFVVGSIGVNKRTKGFPTIIYTAKVLKQQGVDDVLFYCHTEPDSPTMQGHYLRHMAKTYGVNDRVLFKVDVDANTRRQWVGVERDRNNLDELLSKRMPRSPIGRMKLWTQYDFITRMNCFDVYLDVSQVEGWGMPQLEAMACGVPVLYPDDGSCRTELLKPGVILPTLPERLWDTWHTGARLVTFDPEEVAGSILTLRNNKPLMQAMSTEGLNWTCHFKWDKTREEMNKRVKEVYETGS